MLRLLHTSDWHLGKRLGDFSRLPEQREVLDEICDIADREKVHAILIAGDVFDTYNPPVEAIELFYKTLKKLGKNGERAVVVIAGNHDSPDRIHAPDPLARECGIILAGFPAQQITPFKLESGLSVESPLAGIIKIQLADISFPLNVIHTAYANEFRMQTFMGTENPDDGLRSSLQKFWSELAEEIDVSTEVSVLLSHLYMVERHGERPPEPLDEEKPIRIPGGASEVFTDLLPECIQYTALGHLHRRQCIGRLPSPVIYSGSPLSYSFSEASQKKFVEIVELLPGVEAVHRSVELNKGKPLLRKTFNSVEEAISWLSSNQNCLAEITLKLDKYLSGAIIRQLHSVHPGIVGIVPDINFSEADSSITALPDLSDSIDGLFISYFKSRHGHEPDEALMGLFHEVLSDNSES